MSDVNPLDTSSHDIGDHCARTFDTNSPPPPSEKYKKNIPYHIKYAKQLHEAAYIYALYGLLDGLSLSYSMVKYGFDVLYETSKKSSSDEMHDWMITPSGAIAAGTEALTFITLSFIANTSSDDDPNALKRFIATAWPYMRDALKGIKNAFKGLRSALLAGGLLTGQSLKHLIVPMGLIIGVLVAVNRIWYRSMREQRKDMMQQNEGILTNLKKNTGWPVDECGLLMSDSPPDPNDIDAFPMIGHAAYVIYENKIYYVNKIFGTYQSVDITNSDVNKIKKYGNKDQQTLNKSLLIDIEKLSGIKHQTIDQTMEKQKVFLHHNRNKGLISQFFNGVIDGLYLYMGVLCVTTIAPQFFMLTAAISMFFAVSCVVTRVHEENEYQKKLTQSQMKIKFAMSGKELEMVCLNTLKELEGLEKLSGREFDESLNKIANTFENHYNIFIEKRKNLANKLRVSTTSAAITGLQNGLSAYGVLASALFAVATVQLLCGAAVSAPLVIGTVMAGLACAIGFMAFAIYKNHQLQKAQKEALKKDPTLIFSVLDKINQAKVERAALKEDFPCEEEVKLAILEGMTVDPSIQYFFQETFEVFRSLLSGVAKGYKALVHILNALLEKGEDGHYKEPFYMLVLTVLSAGIFSAVLGLRALARGFGRNKVNECEEVDFECEQQKLAKQNQVLQCVEQPVNELAHTLPNEASLEQTIKINTTPEEKHVEAIQDKLVSIEPISLLMDTKAMTKNLQETSDSGKEFIAVSSTKHEQVARDREEKAIENTNEQKLPVDRPFEDQGKQPPKKPGQSALACNSMFQSKDKPVCRFFKPDGQYLFKNANAPSFPISASEYNS